MAWMETGYEMNPEMRAWVSPSLIEANYILSLSQQELQNVIETEMAQNPALELEDRATCPVCDSVLEGTWCPVCRTNHSRDENAHEPLDHMDDSEPPTSNALRDDDPEFDPMTLVATNQSILEQILADAHIALEPEEHPIAMYILDSLDDRGFMTMSIGEIARELDVDPDLVSGVLCVIQDVAPIGVGARDLRECLLLQLNYLERSGATIPPHTREVVDTYLGEFGAHKFGQIARSLGISVEDLEVTRDYVRSHLNPFPLQSDQARSWRTPTDSQFVSPDVIIDIRDDELAVEIADNRFFHLRTNAMYDELAHRLSRKRTSSALKLRERLRHDLEHDAEADQENVVISEQDVSSVSTDEKAHIRQYTNRARMFMSNIQQRRDTLLRISLAICELQENFLRGGVRELRPLTRALVAQQVGVHESTVSRATANKYVMLPSRKVIPFSDFFTPSLSTKDIIKEIIEREARKGEPLTDRKICDLLLDDGIRIARRTVAKYRAELGILPSTMR